MTTTSVSLTGLRFLRPYLCKDLQITHRSAYIRFFNSTTRRNIRKASDLRDPVIKDQQKIEFRGDVAGRIEILKQKDALDWPRIQRSSLAVTCREYVQKYKKIKPGQVLNDEFVVIRGTCTDRLAMLIDNGC